MGTRVVLLLLIAQLDALSARAQDPPAPARDLTALSLTELAELEVTSVSKKPEKRWATPTAIDLITSADLRNSGATTLVEALRGAPGVHVARIDSSKWAVGIRGFSSRLSRAQLVLVDGRSVYTPLFAGTYWEVQDTLLDDVDRIEVVRGPGGTLWGANAVNGVVSVMTRSARDTQGGLLAGGAGSEENGFFRARYGSHLGSRGYYRAYGKYADRAATFHDASSGFDGWHLGQLGFRTDWEIGDADHLVVQGDAYRGAAGQITNFAVYEPPFTRRLEEDARFSGGNLLSRWRRVLSGTSELDVRFYYDRTSRNETSFGETRDTVDLDLQHRARLDGRQELVWGAGYRLSAGRARGVETIVFAPSSRTDHLFTGFVQDEIALAAGRVRLDLGAKLEHNGYSGFALQPSARLLWTPAARHVVWAGLTRALRTPSRVEHDLLLTASLSPSAPLFARVTASREFDAESVTVYEAGVRTQPSAPVLLDASVFHNRYPNLLSLERGTTFAERDRQIVPLLIANLLRARVRGVELSTHVQLTASLRLFGGYSFLDMDMSAAPGSTDASQLAAGGSSPRHRIHLRGDWALAREVDVGARVRWVDELPAQRVPAYTSLDARVAWRPYPALELAVVGSDLLRARHAEFGGGAAGLAQVERAVFGEVVWRW
jgi:iron complex outermembrane receptor protein